VSAMAKRESTSGITRLFQSLEEQAKLIEDQNKKEGISEDNISDDISSSDMLSQDILSPDILSKDDSSIDTQSSDTLSLDKKSSDKSISSDKISPDKNGSYDNLSPDKMSVRPKLSPDNLSSDTPSPDTLSDVHKLSPDKMSQESTLSPDKMSVEQLLSRDILSYDGTSKLEKVCEIVPFLLPRIGPYIIRQSSLSPQARLILSFLITVSLHQISPVVCLSQASLAKETGTTSRTVLRLIHELNDQRWIEYFPNKSKRINSKFSCEATFKRFIEEVGLPIKVCEIFDYLDKLSRENIDVSLVSYVSYIYKEQTNKQNQEEPSNIKNAESSVFFSQYEALKTVIAYALVKNFDEGNLNKSIMKFLIDECKKKVEGQTISDAADLFELKMKRSIYYVSLQKNVKNSWRYLKRTVEESWGEYLIQKQIEDLDREIKLLSQIESDKNLIDGMSVDELEKLNISFPHILSGEKVSNKNASVVREKFKEYYAGVFNKAKTLLNSWNISAKSITEEI